MVAAGSVIEQDKLVDNLLDRIAALETRLAAVERVAAASLLVIEAGTAGTELAWIEVTVGGVTGYVRVFASR